MTSQTSRRLSSLSEEISALERKLGQLQDLLEVQRQVLDESRLRMLIAETPLADRDLQRAAHDFLSVDGEIRRVEEALDMLRSQQTTLTRDVTAGT